MTTQDHIARVRRLATQAMAWEAQDDSPVCQIGGACTCPTCGLTTALLRSELSGRGWDRADTLRVATIAPTEASYPHLASVRVDGVEVYRVHADLAEVLDPEVLADIEAALRRTG